MARNDRLERILAAWYALNTATTPYKAHVLADLNRFLDDARRDTYLSRQDIVEALRERFDAYYAARLKEDHALRNSAT